MHQHRIDRQSRSAAARLCRTRASAASTGRSSPINAKLPVSAKLGDVVAGLAETGTVVRYLEDIAAGIGTLAKPRAAVAARVASRRHRALRIAPDSPAATLFTRGSEGVPWGVVLTHRNLLANCRKLSARIDFNERDVVLNALPVFHSFGLTGGTLLPILSG